MSISAPSAAGSKNPATKFLEWSSAKKSWKYWDKTKEAEIVLPVGDLTFIVLDQLNTVKGFDEAAASGIWSNEVRNVTKEPFIVKNKKRTVAEGLWNDIKAQVSGLKFTKSVYGLAKLNGRYELVNLQLNGASVGAWFEFCDTAGDLDRGVVVSTPNTAEGKKGAVTYFMPAFQIVSNTLTEEDRSQAVEADKKLQAYLKAYFAQKGQEDAPEPPQEARGPAIGSEFPSDDTLDEDVPF